MNFLFILPFFAILASLSISLQLFINFASSGVSGWWKFPEQLSNLILQIKFNVSGTFLSNYKYFSCQSSYLLLLLEVCKNHYSKENIRVGGSKQQGDALFWIHLRKTWLELFRLLQMSLIFSIFIFSIGIKLFIWHSVGLFWILILSEQFDGFVRLHHWWFLKTDSYVFINTWNTKIFSPLSLRKNESKYKQWLELGCFCKLKQTTNNKI